MISYFVREEMELQMPAGCNVLYRVQLFVT